MEDQDEGRKKFIEAVQNAINYDYFEEIMDITALDNYESGDGYWDAQAEWTDKLIDFLYEWWKVAGSYGKS